MMKSNTVTSVLAVLALAGIGLSGASAADKSVARIFSNPGSVQRCFSHVHRCIVPVYVHALTGGDCSVWIDPEKIMVPPKDALLSKIKIVFVLKKGDPTTKIGQFKFDPDYGFNPADPTQAKQEFTSEGYDKADAENPDADDDTSSGPASRRFRLASTHLYTGYEAGFVLKVIRTTSGVTCASADPTITNTN